MDTQSGGLENAPLQHLILSSSNISGDRDRERVESDLGGVEGVRNVEVDPHQHTVDIEYDPTVVNELRLRAALEGAGYRLSDQTKRGEADQYLQDDVSKADQEGGGAGEYTPGDANFDQKDFQTPAAARVFEE